MAHDPYKEFPKYAPATSDLSPLMDIVIAVKEAARLRHDFQSAAHVAYGNRRLRPPAWESNFAKSYRPDGKTPGALAAEHERLKRDATTRAFAIRGNPDLGKLVRENIALLFPDIGYSASSGAMLLKMGRPDRTLLRVFHPLGVDDFANLIRLLLKKFGNAFYW